MKRQTIMQWPYLGGSFILSLLAIPVWGIVVAFFWLGAGFCCCCEAVWSFFNDLWRSCFDPSYIPPLGYSAAMARAHRSSDAFAAADNGDWPTAVEKWKQNRKLYDINGWYRLGKCYEEGKGVEQDLALAYEHYRFAAQYGVEEACFDCERLQQHSFSRKQRDKFLHDVWAR